MVLEKKIINISVVTGKNFTQVSNFVGTWKVSFFKINILATIQHPLIKKFIVNKIYGVLYHYKPETWGEYISFLNSFTFVSGLVNYSKIISYTEYFNNQVNFSFNFNILINKI